MARPMSTVPQKHPQPIRKRVAPRTPQQRRQAKASPLARAVIQHNAPRRTRRFIFLIMSAAAIAILLMMVVVIFQTRLAETQLKIDDIESLISKERSRYDELRLERSILRDPQRLVLEATALGMVPGIGTNFSTVDPLTMAAVLVSTQGADPALLIISHDPLQNYGAVKATIGQQP